MPDKSRPYKIIDHQRNSIGRFNIVCDTIQINDEKYPYSYIDNGSYVIIIPIYKGKITIIKQYRHAVNDWIYEFPAGGIDPGEAPLQAAERELKEETGLSGRLICLADFPGAEGTSSEWAYFYIAQCDEKTKTQQEPTELIKSFEVTEDELDTMIFSGKFQQISGIAAWHIYKMMVGVKNI